MTEILIKLPLPMTPEAAKLAIQTIGQLCGPALLAGLNAEFKATAAAIPPAPGGNADDEGEVSTATADKSGLPWDERIHTAKKTVNQDGSWKRRRGVDDATVAAVEAELRVKTGTVGTIPAFLERTAAPVPPAPPAPAAAAPVPPAPPAPAALAEAAPVSYAGIMTLVGQNISAKKLSMSDFQGLLTENGLSISTLKDSPHMFEIIKAQIDAKANG